MFKSISTTTIAPLGITAKRFRHSCGMEAVSLECDDTENLCAFGFTTIPTDSSGIQHVIEHCVCEGSLHFPVKSPFSELERTSMATLLNAFTYNDHTVFPFASVNPTDFFNIFEVYWDCVFQPTLTREIFQQEGWHLAFKSPGRLNSKLIENGIVLNEMNAAMSELDTLIENELLSRLLPEFPLSQNSGGNPDQIVNLSYEDFLAYYRSHYTPANTKILLYGNIPTEKKLDFLEKHLASLPRPFPKAPKQSRIHPTKWHAPKHGTVMVASRPDLSPDEQVAWACAWLVKAHSTPKERLIADLLDSILFDNEGAPLKKTILEFDNANDIYSNSGFDTETPQIVFSIGATGIVPNFILALQQKIHDTLQTFVVNGPTPNQLNAAFKQLKIEKREIDSAFLYNLIDDVFDGWIHDNDPLTMLDNIRMLDELEAEVHANPQLLTDFVRDGILRNNRYVSLWFKPSTALPARKKQAKEQRLKTLKASMSHDELKAIAEQQKRLLLRQTTPDTPEALATLPHLARKDISPFPLPFNPDRLTTASQVPILSEDVQTNGLHYLKIAFPLDIFSEEDMGALPLFVSMLNHLGTAKHDYAAFDDLLAAAGAYIEFDYSIEPSVSPAKSSVGILSCRFSSLDETLPIALDFLHERLTQTVFTEKKRITELLRQRYSKFSLAIQEDSHLFTRLRAGAGLTPSATCLEHWQGLAHYRECRQNARTPVSGLPSMIERLERMMSKLVAATPLAVVHVGPSTGRAQLLGRFQTPCLDHATPFRLPTDWTFGDNGRREAYPITCDVGATALYHRAPGYSSSDCAALCVYAELLGSGPVWEQIRIQRGAYGATCRYLPFEELWYIGSARDPSPTATMDIIASLDDSIPKWTERELEGAVISQLKDSPPRPPRRCDSIMFAELTGLTYEQRLHLRQQILQLTMADVRQAAERLRDTFSKERNICIAASRAMLRKSSLDIIPL